MSASAGGPAAGNGRAAGGRVPALLVTHAGLAPALLEAAKRVYGPFEGVEMISNEGLSRDALQERIVSIAGGWPAGGLVLTDFWGGSCHTSGLAAAGSCHGVVILSGVNLPMLLDYLHNRDTMDISTLAERLQQKGRDSIRVQRGPGA